MPRNVFLLVFCLFVLLIFPCRAVRAGNVTDGAGRRISVPDPPHRIISLAPSITEIVYSLDRGNLLVGATQYSTHPEKAKKLPRVGSYIRLDIEKIVALRPDLCLAIKDGNPVHVVEKLESLSIPVYVIDPRNLDGIMDAVRRFGNLLAASMESKNLIQSMKSRLDKVAALVAKAGSRPRVFFQIDAAPIISAGDNTFINELITRAGGTNLAAGPQAYPQYNWEEIHRLQPEIAIVASMAGGHSPEELMAGWQRWPQIPAVKNGRIHIVDANLIDRPTPRLVDGLEIFAKIIHPELFGGIRAD
jgi:iron complex transport system substrate-binding protein